jgi:hypothetical protein
MPSYFKRIVALVVVGGVIALIAATPRVIRQFTSVGVDSTARFDSLASVPFTEAGKVYVFGGGVGKLYAQYADGSRHNLDSTGSGSVTVVSHTPVFKWRSLSTVPDSQYAFKLPAAATLDSIYAFQLGASAMTIQCERNRSGTVVDLLSSNYSMTTTNTKATTLQNNTLLLNDEIWAVVKTVTGTTTQVNITFFLHASQ